MEKKKHTRIQREFSELCAVYAFSCHSYNSYREKKKNCLLDVEKLFWIELWQGHLLSHKLRIINVCVCMFDALNETCLNMHMGQFRTMHCRRVVYFLYLIHFCVCVCVCFSRFLFYFILFYLTIVTFSNCWWRFIVMPWWGCWWTTFVFIRKFVWLV